jgi:hypothetical protein
MLGVENSKCIHGNDAHEFEDSAVDLRLDSVIKRKNQFVHHLTAWRNSRSEYMRTISQPMRQPVHADDSRESAVQTDMIQPLTASDSSIIPLPTRLRIECPSLYAYLRRPS